ncbi:MAG: aspartate dehydrogenase domain-containing protein [Qingshengfaniella sp.]
MTQIKKIGLIGAGAIGTAILQDLRSRPDVEIAFVLVRNAKMRSNDLDLPDGVLTGNENDVLHRSVDLVIEAALPDLVARLGPCLLRGADVCSFSGTALADREVEASIRAACIASGRAFYVPHGAILGLDGLSDGRESIEKVVITTTKSGQSLGLGSTQSGVLYEGSARGACVRFPRNVNVHAAVSLAGLGFDATVSRIVAVPGQLDNVHRIEVSGPGLSWDIKVSSRSLGGVTGAYTPQSAVGSVRRILGGGGITLV